MAAIRKCCGTENTYKHQHNTYKHQHNTYKHQHNTYKHQHNTYKHQHNTYKHQNNLKINFKRNFYEEILSNEIQLPDNFSMNR